jgi:hypothetical protein
MPSSNGTAEAPPGVRTIKASITTNICNFIIEASRSWITAAAQNIANGGSMPTVDTDVMDAPGSVSHDRRRRESVSLPPLAPLRHADCIEQCPLSGVTRKTCVHVEFF